MIRRDDLLNADLSSTKHLSRAALSVATGDKSKAADLYKSAQVVIDSVADKGIFHKNKAARHKSRLSAKIKALAA